MKQIIELQKSINSLEEVIEKLIKEKNELDKKLKIYECCCNPHFEMPRTMLCSRCHKPLTRS